MALATLTVTATGLTTVTDVITASGQPIDTTQVITYELWGAGGVGREGIVGTPPAGGRGGGGGGYIKFQRPGTEVADHVLSISTAAVLRIAGVAKFIANVGVSGFGGGTGGTFQDVDALGYLVGSLGGNGGVGGAGGGGGGGGSGDELGNGIVGGPGDAVSGGGGGGGGGGSGDGGGGNGGAPGLAGDPGQLAGGGGGGGGATTFIFASGGARGVARVKFTYTVLDAPTAYTGGLTLLGVG